MTATKTLRNHVYGQWQEPTTGFTELRDPSTEEVIGRASTAGVDFKRVVEYARTQGGPALRELTFAERGALLAAMAKAVHAGREELIDLSLRATGATRKDAKFDLDGASGTLAYYGGLGAELGARRVLADGDGVQLGRTAKFWGQHVRVPLTGVAVHINAFNFPAWGLAEKAAAAILAGVPVITKPATATAMVTERLVAMIVDAKILPAGALSLLCGSVGDLTDHLGVQDVLAFTGSAATGLLLRRKENLLAANVRVNIEADSLNAAVLGPDAAPGGETWNLFLRDVEREITQKSGQKCTAVRRIFVPAAMARDVETALAERLAAVKVGNPVDESVTMGPLATAAQLKDAIAGVRLLRDSGAQIVHGTGERTDGIGAPRGKGYFMGPCLLRADRAEEARAVHNHEVFAPVSTVLPYDGSAATACRLVALGGGSLVTSVYSDDAMFVESMLAGGGAAWSGRMYLGSEKMAEQAPGSGVALPMSLHGGPGRAGGGAELGGLRALDLYTQRAALQGSRPMIERLTALAPTLLVVALLALGIVFSASRAASIALAASPAPEQATVNAVGIGVRWNDLRKQWGVGWTCSWDQRAGLPAEIAKGSAEVTGGKGGEAIARAFVTGQPELFGLAADGVTIGTAKARDLEDGQVEVAFPIAYRGIDLLDGSIAVVLDKDRRVIRVRSSAWPVRGLATDKATERLIDAARVREIIVSQFGAKHIAILDEPRLFVRREGCGRLVYAVRVHFGDDLHGPLDTSDPATARRVVLDAQSGMILDL